MSSNKNILYHYTDFSALDGILSNSELRLNNILNMNDAAEWTERIFSEEKEQEFVYSAYAAFKHPSFASENEVRLVVSPFEHGYFDVQPRYHITKERIKKYYPVNMRELCRIADTNLEDVIVEMIVGPESTQSVPILQDYLTDHGYTAMAKKVTHSACPLRQRI